MFLYNKNINIWSVCCVFYQQTGASHAVTFFLFKKIIPEYKNIIKGMYVCILLRSLKYR